MITNNPATPLDFLKVPFRNKELIWELTKRDFIGRYKGSILGVLWSLFNPLLMLTVYTFVFSVAFKAKWGTNDESKAIFAIVLFSGMIIHSFFAECLNRAPNLIIAHPNYVKKVVFPLEILPWVTLNSAMLHMLVSCGVLLFFCLLLGAAVHAGALLIPVILIPLALMILGLSFLFASLGVYLRDLAQAIHMITAITMFMAPIFYPIEALPESYQALIKWNPITLPIVQLRDLMLWGKPIEWEAWATTLAVGLVVCQAGFWWFQKSRRGFADVL